MRTKKELQALKDMLAAFTPIRETKDGKYFFEIRSRNGDALGVSRPFGSHREALEGVLKLFEAFNSFSHVAAANIDRVTTAGHTGLGGLPRTTTTH